MSKVPDRARVVIIGGGVIGCSLAYHLSLLGWTDIVLLERKQLTSGTTWHAAGLITQLRASANLTKLAKYSQELYGSLEKETGVATGFKRVGSITLALTKERQEEICRSAAMARSFSVDAEEISPQEIAVKYPHVNMSEVKSGVFLEKDAQGDPGNIALALAKGARMRSANIFENIRVESVVKNKRRIQSVNWKSDDGQIGNIKCEEVVNCAGMWGHEVGRMTGTNVPLHACEHFYMISEPIPDLAALPILRVPDEYAYYKEDAGKIMLGAFEKNSKPWGMNGIPEGFEFDQLPDDFDHFEPVLEMATNRFPLLAEVGVHTFFNGPESFTPDNAYHLGLAPEMDNVWVAAGFNSIGIQSAGGVGMALSQWMDQGERPFDLGDVDISRAQAFQSNKKFLFERSKETLGLLYANHFPYKQKETARGIRRSPFHEHLKSKGAVFGESAGWERANWFSDPGQNNDYVYSWKRQNWFKNAEREHTAIRQNVGVYDMSSFGKIKIEGPDSESFLNYVCGANLSVPTGKIVYTQLLNSKGGIEADVTVTRLTSSSYILVTSSSTVVADQAWLYRNLGDFQVVLTDVTASESVLAVMGPNSRKLLQAISPNDFSNKVNPFGTCQQIEIGMAIARAHRISYVGELGWELYISSEMANHIFEVIVAAGEDFDLKLCGMHAVDSCRIEKAFRHFGHDITCEDHVLEAGLGFAVDSSKARFLGRDAVLEKKSQGISKKLLQFFLKDPQYLLYQNEPIYRDGKLVSYIRSGAYGYSLKGAVGLGYIPCEGEEPNDLLRSSFEIDVAGCRVPALASNRPLYDPKANSIKL